MVAADIRLYNAKDTAMKPVCAQCIVDKSIIHLCIPAEMALRLKLEETERRNIALPDGSVVEALYVGPLKVQFEDRSCFTGAIVMGDSVLLGAIPIEDMDLIAHPKLSVHPSRSNMVRGLAT